MPILKLFIVLAIQVLIVNQIHLFGYITPLFIGYVIISERKGISHIMLLLLGFIIGLLLAGLLTVLKVRGGLLMTILAITAIGIPLGVTMMPDILFSIPDSPAPLLTEALFLRALHHRGIQPRAPEQVAGIILVYAQKQGVIIQRFK